MSKLYSSKEIGLVLNLLGYSFVSQKGSHGKYKNNEGIITILPMNKKEIPESTLSCILKQVNISKKEFIEHIETK
ncbi:MAG: hypothetical protein HW421_1691 [Ignavibacteria bacterium]|nr:hypothetical protein [Ignavibacteria bacterium]